MSNRYDQSRQRNYSELCNRSSTRSSMVGRYADARMSYPSDTFEDYWEDASVSIRAFHGHEAPSTSMRSAGACLSACEEDESKAITAPASHETLIRRDSTEFTACSKRQRSFPPPLSLCSTLSIKGGGRFVLKEMDADRPQGFFLVQRGNGRLRLQLVLTEDDDDEEDDHGEESFPAEVDSSEPEACGEEASTSNGSRSLLEDDEVGLSGVSDENGRCGRGGAMVDGEKSEGMVYSDASLTWQEAAMDARLQRLNGERLTILAGGDGHHHVSDTNQDTCICGKKEAAAGVGESHGFLTFHDTELIGLDRPTVSLVHLNLSSACQRSVYIV